MLSTCIRPLIGGLPNPIKIEVAFVDRSDLWREEPVNTISRLDRPRVSPSC